jgi:hypothetical protein
MVDKFYFLIDQTQELKCELLNLFNLWHPMEFQALFVPLSQKSFGQLLWAF